jgi:hypothetical protein
MPFYPDEMQDNPAVSDLTFADGKRLTSAHGRIVRFFSPRFGFNYDVMGDRSFQSAADQDYSPGCCHSYGLQTNPRTQV